MTYNMIIRVVPNFANVVSKCTQLFMKILKSIRTTDLYTLLWQN